LIVLRNGEEKLVKVLQVGEQQIAYRSCKNIYDTTRQHIPKQKVLLVRYPDGSKDIIKQPPAEDTTAEQEKEKSASPSESTSSSEVKEKEKKREEKPERFDALALLSFFSSITPVLALIFTVATGVGAGVFYLVWLVGSLLAVILGIVSLIRMGKNERLKGQGFAYLGTIIGGALLVIFLMLLVIILWLASLYV
jgi:cation transport ATPase